jgi:DNA (cytosine-5)-methyltransferase 1
MKTSKHSNDKPKVISLFSGAMGLDLGLHKAGFDTAVANEVDEDCVRTMRFNRPDMPVIDRSVTDVTGRELLRASGLKKGDVDLVAGGPPCQPFSVFGNRKGTEDDRGQLVFEYVRIVSETKPKIFLMENVRGLLSMPAYRKGAGSDIPLHLTKPGSLVQFLFEKFNEIGYRVDLFVVNSVNYGAPQIRERVLLIGNRFGLECNFPDPQFSNRPEDGLPEFRTLGDAIGDGFVDSCPEVLNFSPRKLKYLSMVPPGGNWRSLPVEIQKESMGKSWYLKGGRSAYWRKLSFAFPSPTVVTMPNHAGTSMCHPTELRAISVGEAKAIQEFPASWQLQGSTASKFKQVGNAVPVRLGHVAGQAIRELLDRIDAGERGKRPHPDNRIVHLRPHVRTKTYFKDGQAFAGDQSYYKTSEQLEFEF